ncbi:MAG: hypothetical protein LUQ05_05285, partial [Methanoregula sp.]|nr:hypothetical protein [Methanoregula sp.]
FAIISEIVVTTCQATRPSVRWPSATCCRRESSVSTSSSFCVIADSVSQALRKSSIFTIIGGIFFAFSALLRFYGGFAIPVGVPFVIFIGWWMYKETFEPEGQGESVDDGEPSVAE